MSKQPPEFPYTLDDLICSLVKAVCRQVQEWAPPVRNWKFEVRRHKANVVEVEGAVFWHRACWTDRRAFCVLECTDTTKPKPVWEERLRWYVAMGCDQQHPLVQTTLARVSNSACVLTAVLALLPRLLPTVRLYKELILTEVPDAQRRGGNPAQVRRALDLHLESTGTVVSDEPGTLSLVLRMILGEENHVGVPVNLASAFETYKEMLRARRAGPRQMPRQWQAVDPSRLTPTPR